MTFGPQTPSGIVATQPFLAFWAVVALARAMARDPRVRSRVPITWVPAHRLEGERLVLAGGRAVPLTAPQARLAAVIDGRRSPAELAELATLSAVEADLILARLERLGVVRTWPEPSSATSQPFKELRADADRLAGDTAWPRRLAELWVRVEAFAGSDDPDRRRAALAELERSFQELADVPPRRAGGKMYADRMVGYLECEGDLGPVRLGTHLARDIERELAPVLDVGARYAELVRQTHQRAAREVLAAAGVPRMPYDEFVRRMQAGGESAQPVPPAAAALIAALTDLVRERTSGGVCWLTPADLRRIAVPEHRIRFASPDLLLRSPSGIGDRSGTGGQSDTGDANPGARDEPVYVLGEVHPYVFAWGSQRHFCPDPAGLQADFAAELACWGGAATMATVVPRRRHKGLIAETFPGRFVELTAMATRERERAVPITGLAVEDAGDRVLLRDGDGAEVVVYAGQDDHAHLLAFAPPGTAPFPLIRLGDSAPRIVVGSLVPQRAAWWIPAGDLLAGRRTTGGAGGFCAVQQQRVRRGVPRWVYAHVTGEPKPVCIDLDCPLGVDTLLAMVADRAADTVLLREMLPEPGGLWLRRDGRRVTSELRLAMVRGAM